MHVFTFNNLAEANDFRMGKRQVAFLCWTQDSKLGNLGHQIASRLNVHSQTDWSIEDQAKKTWMQQSLWLLSIHPNWLHCRLDFTPGFGDILVCCCWIWCSGTGRQFSNRKETSCFPLLYARFKAGKSETPNCQKSECPLTKRLSYRGSS